MDFNFSKEDFIEWTTKGYPLELSATLTKETLLDSLTDFVNFNDNKFSAEFYQDIVNIYEENEDLIMSVVYKNGRVIMLTDINDQNVDEQTFSLLTRQKILGQACLGVITFCQTLSSFFETGVDLKDNEQKKEEKVKSNIQVAWLLND